MRYGGKSIEEFPQEETTVWTCTSKDCNGWMRDNFAFSDVPVCHRCHSPMVSSVKMLPQLVNTNKDLKSMKQGIRI